MWDKRQDVKRGTMNCTYESSTIGIVHLESDQYIPKISTMNNPQICIHALEVFRTFQKFLEIMMKFRHNHMLLHA